MAETQTERQWRSPELPELEAPMQCQLCLPEGPQAVVEVDQMSEPSEEDTDQNICDVQALPPQERCFTTEQDAAEAACRKLALQLRPRPTLPPHPGKLHTPWLDVASATRLPLWHCAFK
eukprot:4858318-Karenia_brevis.AAC.1